MEACVLVNKCLHLYTKVLIMFYFDSMFFSLFMILLISITVCYTPNFIVVVTFQLSTD